MYSYNFTLLPYSSVDEKTEFIIKKTEFAINTESRIRERRVISFICTENTHNTTFENDRHSSFYIPFFHHFGSSYKNPFTEKKGNKYNKINKNLRPKSTHSSFKIYH